MILSFALPPIEKILNYYLQLDPETDQRLHSLAGKVVAINFDYLGCTLYFLLRKKNIHLTDHYAGQVDVTLRGTPLDFLRFNFLGNHSTLFGSDIVLEGDTDVAQQFKELFAHLDVDWEEQLSKVTGDVVAHQVGKFFRSLCAWARESSATLRQDISEYVQEEVQLFPPREELQDFFREVDQLRNDVERMELRIKRLK